MKANHWIALGAALLLLPSAVAAQSLDGRGGGPGRGHRGPPPFMAELFPPALIMRHQSDLGLDDSQKQAIMKAVSETRTTLDPLQWELAAKEQDLTTLVAAPTVDEAALLVQAEEVMNLEKEVKKSHLLLLVRIKNQLTPEQQKQAKTLKTSRRRQRLGGPPNGRGRGPLGRAP